MAERETLIAQAKKLIKARRETARIYISEDFYNGFEEGVAEFLAVQLQESAMNLLEEITK